MKQLRSASIEAIDQIRQLLQALTPCHYGGDTKHSSSTIGAHVRHVVDHYLALRQALEAGRENSAAQIRINFNHRNRNNVVERDINVAKAMLVNLTDWLRNTDLNDEPVVVESEISLSSTCSQEFSSTLSRELCYLINHTVHHSAYMVVIARQLGVTVESSIGVAPATGSYLRSVNGRQQAEA